MSQLPIWSTCQRSEEKSGEKSKSDSWSSKTSYGDDNLPLPEEDTFWSFNKQCKTVEKDLWRDVELQDVKKYLIHDIDGRLAYRVISPILRLSIRKVKDGRLWKRDSSTK